MFKSCKQVIEDYARKHSLNEKEVIDILCAYVDSLEKKKITYDSTLETFLENMVGYKFNMVSWWNGRHP